MSAETSAIRLRSRTIRAIVCAASVCALLPGFAGIGQIHAGLFRAPLANPYCRIPTFVVPVLRGEARALLDDGIAPVILVNARMLEWRNYTHFLLAHECCHHKLGHLPGPLRKKNDRIHALRENGLPGERPAPRTAFSPRSPLTSRRQIELAADCCAARHLALLGDSGALNAAITAMSAFGPRATGRTYPSGIHRAAAIKLCAGLE